MQKDGRIECACGRSHADAAHLVKVGWQQLCDGELALLVNCPCGSTICAELLTDAALCVVCRRVVTGEPGDPKIVAYPGPLESGVHCRGCANRSGILQRAA